LPEQKASKVTYDDPSMQVKYGYYYLSPSVGNWL